MLSYNEIKEGKIIIYEDEPYEVLTSWVFRKQQRKPVNQTKLRSVLTGRIAEITFHDSDKVGEAEIESRKIKYIYNKKDEYWFSPENNPKERFSLDARLLGEKGKFLKEGTVVDLAIFIQGDEETNIGIKMPIKMEFLVLEAPPSIKGNTATGGMKQAKIETGAMIHVPLFVNQGDTIRVNTETGDYVERV